MRLKVSGVCDRRHFQRVGETGENSNKSYKMLCYSKFIETIVKKCMLKNEINNPFAYSKTFNIDAVVCLGIIVI